MKNAGRTNLDGRLHFTSQPLVIAKSLVIAKPVVNC